MGNRNWYCPGSIDSYQFTYQELQKWVEGNVHRMQGDTTLRFAEWALDLASRSLTRGETAVELTNAEFKLLSTFLNHPGRVLSRDQLLALTRSDPGEVFDRSIDYLVMRLRRKLEDNPKQPELIRTEHGAGYIFTAEVETSR